MCQRAQPRRTTLIAAQKFFNSSDQLRRLFKDLPRQGLQFFTADRCELGIGGQPSGIARVDAEPFRLGVSQNGIRSLTDVDGAA